MKSEIVIKKLTQENLRDYETLTKHGDDGKLCYCSFWHQKWSSMDEYKRVQSENPTRLKECVVDRVKSGFHVGVVAYVNDAPCAWISVGPLTDFYWAWRRIAQVGEAAKTTACILCFTVAPDFRGQKLQGRILKALTEYGRGLGWTSIESYPFSDEAHAKHGDALKWAGFLRNYEKAGFKNIGPHWLSSSELLRHLCQIDLSMSR